MDITVNQHVSTVLVTSCMLQNSWMATVQLIMDNALQWKNLYLVDNATGLVRNTQLRVGKREELRGDRPVKRAGRLFGQLGLNPAWP